MLQRCLLQLYWRLGSASGVYAKSQPQCCPARPEIPDPSLVKAVILDKLQGHKGAIITSCVWPPTSNVIEDFVVFFPTSSTLSGNMSGIHSDRRRNSPHLRLIFMSSCQHHSETITTPRQRSKPGRMLRDFFKFPTHKQKKDVFSL